MPFSLTAVPLMVAFVVAGPSADAQTGGRPLSLVEALSVGTPVVAFNTGGMAEVIEDGKNGLLAPEMTAESLAKTLDKFFKEKQQYNRQAIREDAKLRFEAAIQAAKYLEVYKNF